MDGQADRQTEKFIWCGLPSLRSSRYTHCARAGGTFFQMDRWTDGRTDRDMNPVWASLTTFLQDNRNIEVRSMVSLFRNRRKIETIFKNALPHTVPNLF
jgi:hypothetical protein